MAPEEATLRRFGAATREWFAAAFAAPTAAQAGAWGAISAGKHALVVAPTGSGKTLAAFLWSLDRLAAGPPPEPRRRCRVVYVSPLKALAVDVERNLRAPLTGIRHAASRLGLPEPDITVAMRTGDTPPEQRRAFARAPSDILITTPESLFLLLTSSAREGLRGVETVIVDEVHAVAGAGATARAVGDGAPGGGGGAVPRRRGAGRGGAAPGGQDHRGTRRGPGRGHDRTRGPGLRRPGRPAPALHLAGRRAAGVRPGPLPPVDDRVHQRPSRRRAPLRPPQRTRRRRTRPRTHHRTRQRGGRASAGRGRRRRTAAVAGRDHGPVRGGRWGGAGGGPGT